MTAAETTSQAEYRQMADAALARNAEAGGEQAPDAPAYQLEPAAAVGLPGELEPGALVVVDTGIAGYEQLIADLSPGTEILLLEAGIDGLQTLADHVAGRSDITAIHILSSGDEGDLRLGATRISEGNLDRHADLFRAIGGSLATGGDVVLYGFGADGNGVSLVSRLAEVTGADLAATTGLAGVIEPGSDRNLEQVLGGVEGARLDLTLFQDLLQGSAITPAPEAAQAPAGAFTPDIGLSGGNPGASFAAALALDTGGADGNADAADEVVAPEQTDDEPPTLMISADDVELEPGEMAMITFSFSEEVVGFTPSDIRVTGGRFVRLMTFDKITFTGFFIPQAGYQGTATISVGDNSYTDVEGNNGSGDELTLIVGFVPPPPPMPPPVDTTPPVVNIALNPIGGDDELDVTELSSRVAITGTVGGEVMRGDVVTVVLTDGATVNRFTGTVAADNTFSIIVPGTALAADDDMSVVAWITSEDEAGNVGSAVTTRDYTIIDVPPTLPEPRHLELPGRFAPLPDADLSGAALPEISWPTFDIADIFDEDEGPDPVTLSVPEFRDQIVDGKLNYSLEGNGIVWSDAQDDYEFRAELADGSPLPDYLVFDDVNGVIVIDVAAAERQGVEEVIVVIIAEDNQGNVASHTVTIWFTEAAVRADITVSPGSETLAQWMKGLESLPLRAEFDAGMLALIDAAEPGETQAGGFGRESLQEQVLRAGEFGYQQEKLKLSLLLERLFG